MRVDFPLIAGKVSAGAISNQKAGSTFTTKVDATAGGLANAPSNPWTYLKFTPQGLVQTSIDDVQALTSLDWDIAAKRNQIRLNGGDGGPSYVSAAPQTNKSFEDVATLPAATPLQSESFYDAQCELDATELGQASLLLDVWSVYTSCSSTSGIPFVIQLADGTRLKLVVDAYYATGQDSCNTTGTAGTGGGNFTWRWQYL